MGDHLLGLAVTSSLIKAGPPSPQHPNNDQPVLQQLGHRTRSTDIAPFGFDKFLNESPSSTVSPRSVLTKRAIDYDGLVCKGDRALGMLRNDAASPRIWTQRDLDVAWNIYDADWRPREAIFGELNALGIHPAQDPNVTFHREADQLRWFEGADGQEEVSKWNPLL